MIVPRREGGSLRTKKKKREEEEISCKRSNERLVNFLSKNIYKILIIKKTNIYH